MYKTKFDKELRAGGKSSDNTDFVNGQLNVLTLDKLKKTFQKNGISFFYNK